MELDDCAFPLLAGIDIHDDPSKAFDGANVVPAGGRPAAHEGHGARRPARGQRRHLQAAGRGDRGRRRRRREGARGGQPGQHQRADRDVERRRRAARAVHGDDAARPEPGRCPAGQEGRRARSATSPTSRCGATTRPRCTPTCSTRRWRGGDAWEAVGQDQDWLENDFIPTVGKRGAAIIEARGASSAASAANAAIDHVHDWVLGTPDGDWVSMAVPTAGNPTASRRGSSPRFPCTCSGGEWEIVEGLELTDFSQAKIDATERGAAGGARRGRGARPGLGSAWATSARQAGCQPFPRLRTLPSFCRPGITRYR